MSRLPGSAPGPLRASRCRWPVLNPCRPASDDTVYETGRIDASGRIAATETARLNRERVPSPGDRRAQLYARPAKGGIWTPKTVAYILTSEAALGYLLHGGRPVLGE